MSELTTCFCGLLSCQTVKEFEFCGDCKMWVSPTVVAACCCGLVDPPANAKQLHQSSTTTDHIDQAANILNSFQQKIDWVVCDSCGACSHMACYPHMWVADHTTKFFCSICSDPYVPVSNGISSTLVPTKIAEEDDNNCYNTKAISTISSSNVVSKPMSSSKAILPVLIRFPQTHLKQSRLNSDNDDNNNDREDSDHSKEENCDSKEEKSDDEKSSEELHFQCPLCPMTLSTLTVGQSHCWSAHHRSIAKSKFKKVAKPTEWRCNLCPALKFGSNAGLCSHWVLMHIKKNKIGLTEKSDHKRDLKKKKKLYNAGSSISSTWPALETPKKKTLFLAEPSLCAPPSIKRPLPSLPVVAATATSPSSSLLMPFGTDDDRKRRRLFQATEDNDQQWSVTYDRERRGLIRATEENDQELSNFIEIKPAPPIMAAKDDALPDANPDANHKLDNECVAIKTAAAKCAEVASDGESCRAVFVRYFPFKSQSQIDKWCNLLNEHEIDTVFDLRTLESSTFDKLCSSISASLLFQDLLLKLRG